MKRVIYTPHLVFRLKFREIPYSLPKEIYRDSKEHYFDGTTLRKIAVKKVEFNNRLREMAVVYEETGQEIHIITIHPLKNYQKITRVNSGRWQKI